MPSLAELQRSMAAALRVPTLAAAQLPAQWFTGAVPWSDALRVHRNTTAGACCHALRLSYPSVVCAIGEEFFDALAAEFARAHPPAWPQLDRWGEEFTGAIGAHPALAAMSWLHELARFDWRLERLAQQPAMPLHWGPPHRLAGAAGAAQFLTTLGVLDTAFLIDELHDAVVAGDADKSAALIADRAPRHYALWRAPEGVKVAALSAPAAVWLSARGATAAAACEVPAEVAGELLELSCARRADQRSMEQGSAT